MQNRVASVKVSDPKRKFWISYVPFNNMGDVMTDKSKDFSSFNFFKLFLTNNGFSHNTDELKEVWERRINKFNELDRDNPLKYNSNHPLYVCVVGHLLLHSWDITGLIGQYNYHNKMLSYYSHLRPIRVLNFSYSSLPKITSGVLELRHDDIGYPNSMLKDVVINIYETYIEIDARYKNSDKVYHCIHHGAYTFTNVNS